MFPTSFNNYFLNIDQVHIVAITLGKKHAVCVSNLFLVWRQGEKCLIIYLPKIMERYS